MEYYHRKQNGNNIFLRNCILEGILIRDRSGVRILYVSKLIIGLELLRCDS